MTGVSLIAAVSALLGAPAPATTPAAPATPAPAAAPAPRAGEKPAFNRHTGLFEPPFSELEKAVGRGDRADVARWAARIGPARLAEALRGKDRARVIAALEAQALLPGNVRLLDAITPLVGAADVSIAERAARAVGQILDASEPRRLEDWDVPADAVARGCRGLTDMVQRANVAIEVRLAGLEALADATLICRPPVTPLLSDPTPAIRRAAMLVARPRDELAPAAVKQGLADPDPGVVSATAVAWCRARLLNGKPPATAELARLPAAPPPLPSPPLRELAGAPSTPVEDAVELVACLAASPDAADRKTAEQLRKTRVPQANGNGNGKAAPTR